MVTTHIISTDWLTVSGENHIKGHEESGSKTVVMYDTASTLLF